MLLECRTCNKKGEKCADNTAQFILDEMHRQRCPAVKVCSDVLVRYALDVPANE